MQIVMIMPSVVYPLDFTISAIYLEILSDIFEFIIF
jgi:hypothetical protein